MTTNMNTRGFYAMSFLLSLFGAITVQKNTRDLEAAGRPQLGT